MNPNMQRVAQGGYQRNQLEDFKAKMTGCIVTPGYLRDDFALSGSTVQQIPWTLTQVANNTPINTAQRLKNNDAFLITDIGVYVGLSATTSGAESAAQQNAMILHSMGELGTTGLIGFQAADVIGVNQLYNGWVSIKEGSTTFYEQLEGYSFTRVGSAQAGTLLFTASTQLRSTWEGMNYGFVPVTPQFRIAGNRTYATNLNLGSAAVFAALSGSNGKIYATIRLKGFLATGGARYVDNR